MFLDYLHSSNGAEYFPLLLVPLRSVPYIIGLIVALFSSNSSKCTRAVCVDRYIQAEGCSVLVKITACRD
jgi:hypothetical protein